VELLERAGVAALWGSAFGPGGEGYLRISYANSVENIRDALEAIEAALRGLPEELGIGFGKVAQPIRVAATGSSVSPPLFESLELLGRDRSLSRLQSALQ
jgi:glutamyl-tRNA synthetase